MVRGMFLCDEGCDGNFGDGRTSKSPRSHPRSNHFSLDSRGSTQEVCPNAVPKEILVLDPVCSPDSKGAGGWKSGVMDEMEIFKKKWRHSRRSVDQRHAVARLLKTRGLQIASD